MKVKTNEAKEAYIDINSHLDLSVRSDPKWRGGCTIPNHIISNNIFFVSGYVNSIFLLDILFPLS